MPREAELKLIDVVVGVITDDQDRVLIQQRTDGPFAGQWEFPGGKREPGESYFEALRRELREENGIEVQRSSPLIHITHRYPDREVSLNTFVVDRYHGQAGGAEGQSVRWVSRRALFEADLLAADRPLTFAINLPHEYLITPPLASAADRPDFLRALDTRLDQGAGLVCLRAPDLDDHAYERLARLCAVSCQRAGAALMLHGDARRVALALELGARGVHLPSRSAQALTARPTQADELWLAVSCHSARDLSHAQQLGADFAVAGSVFPTASHPEGGPTLGWEGFAQLAGPAGLPVYAIGGMRRAHTGQARAQGGQGIAAIRDLWRAAAARQTRR